MLQKGVQTKMKKDRIICIMEGYDMRRKVLSIITALTMLISSLQSAAVIAAEPGLTDMPGADDVQKAAFEDVEPEDVT